MRVQVAEGDGGGRAGDDDVCVAQTDEGDEKADAACDRCVQLVGNGAEQPLANSAEGEQQEDDAGDEDGSQGRLPGHAHALDHGVGEVGVEAHTGASASG